MSRLYLVCAICDRRQADGLISGAAWGRLALPAEASVDHPAVKESSARACPTCMGQYPDWQDRALRSLGLASGGYGSQALPAPA